MGRADDERIRSNRPPPPSLGRVRRGPIDISHRSIAMMMGGAAWRGTWKRLPNLLPARRTSSSSLSCRIWSVVEWRHPQLVFRRLVAPPDPHWPLLRRTCATVASKTASESSTNASTRYHQFRNRGPDFRHSYSLASSSSSFSSLAVRSASSSTSSAADVPGDPEVRSHNDDGARLLLYERTPDNYLLMRTGIGFSSFHTLYWLWYNTDFIPTVNASPMNELHIDPALGMAGLAFAIGIQAVFVLYPKRLVSKIDLVQITTTEDDNNNNNSSSSERPRQNPPYELLIYTHTLPFVKPAVTKPTVAKVGKVLLDQHSTELQTVLKECDGDLSLFRGTLGIGTSWPPFLLDVRNPGNVRRPRELLAALLYPGQLARTLAAGGVGAAARGGGRRRSELPSSAKSPYHPQRQPKRGRRR